MIKFGANILSQTVQRNLGRATLDLSTTSERLASGQRINKASDDAAGLAISASLNVNARIFTQGVRNLNDGLSAVNIAEGAMGELGNIIVRIEELATQSISETYSDTQRGALQKEATALTAEWNRIVESTSFNGQSLLTGASTRTVLQGGRGAEATLAVQMGAIQFTIGIDGYAGGTVRANTKGAENDGDGFSQDGGMSADGRYVVFTSNSFDLIPGGSNGHFHIYRRDTQTGETALVSADSSGVMGNSTSQKSSISADGRFVTFSSNATNLVTGDTNAQYDVFLKDMVLGTIVRVSTGSGGTQSLGGASDLSAVSSDGRYVVFDSAATNLVNGDTNTAVDVFLKDVQTGVTSRLSVDSAGNQALGGASNRPSISHDGQRITFVSAATNLVLNDTNSHGDIFLRDLRSNTTTRVSVDGNGAQAGYYSRYASISGDGQFVAFESSAGNLVANDTNSVADIFVKNLATGGVVRASTDSSGNQVAHGGNYKPSINTDGRYVLFGSFSPALVAGDTNGVQDVFRKDLLTGTTTRVNVSSTGVQGDVGTYSTGPSISGDGRLVAFSSDATTLEVGDLNARTDIFLRDLTVVGVQQLAGVVVSNKSSAKLTLDLAQKYRAELLDYRSKLGATTSRITTFVNTLQSSTINYKAASSRITDADIAEEAAKSIAAGIRQQVAASLLGQANQAPQIGLQLLRNA